MKKIIKKHYRIVIGLVIGILISATVVYAAQTVLSGTEVSYNNGTSHGISDNVQGAIDELYGKVNSCKNVNYIATVEDLEKLREEVNNGDSKKGQRYALISDLDLGGKFSDDGTMQEGSTNWEPIGTESHPFSGTFDGMGHIIKKLYINLDSKESKVGLFGWVVNGTIKNLGIEDSYSINNSYSAAMLVGYLNNSTMDNCYNKGNVKGGFGTAGLVSSSNGSTISNCYNTGKIDNNRKQFAAGIVGYSAGTIKNCYNTGQIIGGGDIGGIAGALTSSVTNTYNLGNIDSYSCGGIIGQLYINGLIKNSYNSGTSLGGIVGNIYTNSNQKLENNYYLNTSASWGIYNVDNNSNFTLHSDNNTTPLEKAEMPDVLDIINVDKAFIADTNKINNGNPILKWESK